MRRKLGQGAALLASVVALGGCSWVNPALTTPADAGFGAPFLLPWSDTRTVALADSYTVRRIRGAEGLPPEERLQVDPGNVWPAEESPRATLANPDAALRGVPPWRPGEARSPRDLPVDERPGGPLVQPRADAGPADREPPPRRRRGASSARPPPMVQPETDRVEVLPVPPGAYAPPPRRADGQTILTPGGPVTTTGGTDRIQSFTTPGGGTGVIHRDGNTTTIAPSGGVPQTFPTPR